MTALVLTAAQQRTLSTHAVKGAATVCALGLPDKTGPVVVHYHGESIVIDLDGRVQARGEEAAA